MKLISKHFTKRGAAIAGMGLLVTALGCLSYLADIMQVFENHTVQAFLRLNVTLPLWLYLVVGALSFLVLLTPRRTHRGIRGGSLPLATEGSFLTTLELRMHDATQSVDVCLVGKEWVFPLVLATTFARERGITITVLHDAGSPHERYNLLRNLGCRVCPVDINRSRLPFSGVVIDGANVAHGSVLARSIKPSDGAYSMQHVCPHDWYVVRACADMIAKLSSGCDQSDPYTPTIAKVDQAVVIDKLKGVRFYRDAEVSFEDISIKDVRPISMVIEVYKLQQVRRLISYFKRHQWSLFEPAAIKLKNGNESMIVPPVIEEHDGELVIAEGHTRLYAMRENGARSVKALIVRGVDTEPAAKPRSWRSVRVRTDKRFIDNPDFARRIETAMHQGAWSE